MARSSGGGSRSGSSSRSSSRSSRSSGGSRSSSYSGGRSSNVTISETPFRNSRKFRYYRNGVPHYVYSNTNLCQMRDSKPRWIFILFYIPFIFAIFTMLGEAFSLPKAAFEAYEPTNIAIVDTADVFNSQEERALTAKLKEFGDTTGIATQIITVGYDEWIDNGSLENYALARYYTQFDDENGWLIVYSEQEEGAGDWSWEGIEGDNIYNVMDVFIDKFNNQFQSELVVNQIADPATAFLKAFNKSIEIFENQHFDVDTDAIMPAVIMAVFISVHAFFMIFAGTKKKAYSYKELEEVKDIPGTVVDNSIKCRYCDTVYDRDTNQKCPNCAAIN